MKPRIHHFGRIVKDLDAYLARQSLWEPRGEVVVDPIQKARLVLLGLPGDQEHPSIELVEPTGEDSPVWGATLRGDGWHHVCIEVATRSDGDQLMRERRMLPVTPWNPAVLFGGRPVRFVYSPNRELLELLAHEDEG